MRRMAAVQALGPLALFCTLAASDAAAKALELAPSSESLWRLNLKWLGAFQESSEVVAAILGDGCSQSVVVALPLAACAGFAAIFERPMLLAASSNLAFAYALFVALDWTFARAPMQASLSEQFALSSNSDMIVLAPLLSLCLVSLIVSHRACLKRTLTEVRWQSIPKSRHGS